MAVIGWILVARRAGRMQAVRATIIIRSTATAMFVASVAVSPNNKSEIKMRDQPDGAMAAMMPAASPTPKTSWSPARLADHRPPAGAQRNADPQFVGLLRHGIRGHAEDSDR